MGALERSQRGEPDRVGEPGGVGVGVGVVAGERGQGAREVARIDAGPGRLVLQQGMTSYPPVLATSISSRRVSNQAGPRLAHGQSTIITWPVASSRTLSARTSECTTVSPCSEATPGPPTRGADRAGLPPTGPGPAGERRDPLPAGQILSEKHGRRREVDQRRGCQSLRELSQRRKHPAELLGSPRRCRVPSVDVLQDEHHPLPVVVAAEQTRGRRAEWQGCGDASFPAVQIRRVRVLSPADGLTNARDPVAVHTRSAVPGEKPLACETARTTRPPRTSSTAVRAPRADGPRTDGHPNPWPTHSHDSYSAVPAGLAQPC